MDNLFIARHANYGQDGRINEKGHKQMNSLGESIKKIVNGSSVYLISSTAPRALDSSEELVKSLELEDFEQIPYLWSGNDAPRGSYYGNRDNRKLMSIVNDRAEKADNLIIVSHLEVVENFPSYFVNKLFGSKKNFPYPSKGQAFYLDLVKRNYGILS